VRALGVGTVPVHPPTVTVTRRPAGDAVGTTLTVCHQKGATATRVRNAGWGGVYPQVATDIVPSVLEHSSGSYAAATDVWTTDPAVKCATFESGWDPRDVGLGWPLPELRITSHFGYRYHPILGGRRLHRGTDFGAPSGTDVRAAAAGTVVTAGTDGGFGATVGISHAAGLTTRYSHLSSISVGVGDPVAIGDVVGEVGCTGLCTGPHLHFETWEWGTPVDPMGYLR
jgi:murein DD-endopeptidase MepM/ murein hydrolase activator NlpD